LLRQGRVARPSSSSSSLQHRLRAWWHLFCFECVPHRSSHFWGAARLPFDGAPCCCCLCCCNARATPGCPLDAAFLLLSSCCCGGRGRCTPQQRRGDRRQPPILEQLLGVQAWPPAPAQPLGKAGWRQHRIRPQLLACQQHTGNAEEGMDGQRQNFSRRSQAVTPLDLQRRRQLRQGLRGLLHRKLVARPSCAIPSWLGCRGRTWCHVCMYVR
jgi:hypothetical protein